MHMIVMNSHIPSASNVAHRPFGDSIPSFKNCLSTDGCNDSFAPATTAASHSPLFMLWKA